MCKHLIKLGEDLDGTCHYMCGKEIFLVLIHKTRPICINEYDRHLKSRRCTRCPYYEEEK